MSPRIKIAIVAVIALILTAGVGAGAFVINGSITEAEEREKQDLIDSIDLQILSVVTDDFPTVVISVRYEGLEAAPSVGEFTLTENGEETDFTAVTDGDGLLKVEYQAADSGDAEEVRDIKLKYKSEYTTKTLSGSYTAPAVTALTVTLSQVDSSGYPDIRAYYKVEYADSGETADSIPMEAFVIQEKAESGELLAREIKSVTQLEGSAGLNIGLVADISGSISDSDLVKMKSVMSDFAGRLEYDFGDMAEVLAFNTAVYEMCGFTNDSAALATGISNMSNYGSTALYDALIAAVNRVMQQSGARCVIAFTDGQDSSSTTSVSSLIDYAKKYSVPIFIIGVGEDVEAYTLEYIAGQTGGMYWYIDDLQQLQEVYSSIYTAQKKLYMVEYETSTDLGELETRHIYVSVNSGPLRGVSEDSYTPVTVAADNAGIDVGQTANAYAGIDIGVINDLISQYTKAGTDFSFNVKDLQSGMEIGTSNGRTRMSASALISVPILFTIADGVSKGDIDLDEEILFTYTYSGRGELTSGDSGKYFPIGDLMYYMLTYSDNNATNALINYLTLDRINETCHSYDFLTVDMQRLLTQEATTLDNFMSTSDMVGMLEMLYSDWSGLGKEYLLNTFKIADSTKSSGVGKYISDSYTFLNHNALTTYIYNEIALVSDGKNEYIIAFMSNNGDWKMSAEAAAEITRYVQSCITN